MELAREFTLLVCSYLCWLGPMNVSLTGDMTPIKYTCPNTGFQAQTIFLDDAPENGIEIFLPVTCTACGEAHLVNPKSGKTLGANEWATGVTT